MEKKRLVVVGIIFIFAFLFSLSLISSALAELKNYPVPKACMDQVRKEGSQLNIYDWAEWWPEEIYKGFENEFGIKIVRDNFASEDELVTKFKLNPRAAYDYCYIGVKPFLKLKLLNALYQINHEWIPNVNHYLKDTAKNFWFDAGYHYEIADDLVLVNYMYNSKYINPNDPRTHSWKLLFEGKEYANSITMLDDQLLVIGSALKYLGFSWNTTNEAELMKARDLLLKQKPLVMAYDSWPKRSLLEEEARISQCWSGDSWFLHPELKTIRAVLPKEGVNIDAGLFVIPKHTPHPATAHLWINYLFRPDVNMKLIQAIGYIPQHRETAANLSEEMKKWPGMCPTDAYLKKCEFTHMEAITGKGLALRSKVWKELKK